MNKKKILWLALATLVGFSLLAIPIASYWVEDSLLDRFYGNSSITMQLLIGVIFGLISALLGWQIVLLPFLHDTRVFFVKLIRPMKLNLIQIIFISLCAGIGEEVFFRGALQPLMGIWITAILFVALHGYINPSNIPLTFYGLFMTVVIACFGYLTEEFGLLSAMAAHTVVDIVLLYRLSHDPLELDDEDEDFF